MIDLVFAGLGRDIRVRLSENVDQAAMRAAVRLFMPRWRMTEEPVGAGAADIEVSLTAGRWRIRAASWPGGESFADDSHNAANALAGLLIDAILGLDMAACCLHASAVEVDGRAILFAGASEAGKSTLALRLAARGFRHLADDRMLLAARNPPWRVASTGLAAKARRPLPPGRGLREFVATRIALDDPGIAYLALGDGECACFGEVFPLGGLVLPRRAAGPGTAQTVPSGRGAAARTLIEEATSPAAPGEIVSLLTRLAGSVRAWDLSYGDDGEAAVDALLALWKDGGPL